MLVLKGPRRMQFGRKLEKLDQQIEQLELQLEDLEAKEAVAEAQAPKGVLLAKKLRASRCHGTCHVKNVCRHRTATLARTAAAT